MPLIIQEHLAVEIVRNDQFVTIFFKSRNNMESTKKIRETKDKERQTSKVTLKSATWLTRKMEWLLTEMVQGFQWSRLG